MTNGSARVSNWTNEIMIGGMVASTEPNEGIKFSKNVKSPQKRAKSTPKRRRNPATTIPVSAEIPVLMFK